MKYFSPSYWFKLWVLSAPLFNDKTQGINANSIDNEKIKDWVNKNTSLEVINQEMINPNLSTTYQPYNLSHQVTNQTIDPFYQTYLDSISSQELAISIDKYRHEKSRNRHKRSSNTIITTLIVPLLIRIFESNDYQYLESLDRIRNNLIEEKIIQIVSTNSPTTSNTAEVCIFDPNLPTDNSHLVIMPVVTEEENEEEGVTISLVLTARCLYLQGFILTETNGTRHYFHFNGGDIVDRIDNIPSENTYNLGFKGDYTSLGGNENITWSDIYRSFQYIRSLTNFQYYRNNSNNIFRGDSGTREARRSLVNIILAASESLRTISIRNHLGNMISNGNSINWRTNIRPQASNWNTISCSGDISDIAILSPNAIGTIEANISDQPSTSRGTTNSRPSWYSKTKEKKEEVCSVKKKNKNRNRGTRSIDDCLIINSIGFLQQDSTLSSYVKKGSIWIATNKGVWFKHRDGDYPAQIRQLNESIKSIDVDHQGSVYAISESDNLYYIAADSWYAKKINSENITIKEFKMLINSLKNYNYYNRINNIINEITVIKKVINKNIGNCMQAGDFYIGTDNGPYAFYYISKPNNNLLFKYQHVDSYLTKNIYLNYDSTAYIVDAKNQIYYLNGCLSTKINAESFDLKKELKIYYNNYKLDQVLTLSPTNDIVEKRNIYTLNLGKINPIDNYQKLEFMGITNNNRLKWGSNPNNCWDFTSNYFVHECYFQTLTGKNLQKWFKDRNNNFNDIIINLKVNENISPKDVEQYTPYILQNIDKHYSIYNAWSAAHVFGKQKFGLTWYWENSNYYLQAIFFQYANWKSSSSSLDSSFPIGNGIRLYNDFNNIETQIASPYLNMKRKKRNIFDVNKNKEISELKNTSKWTDDFTKDINQEQYLPIANNTNYVANNITNL